MPDQLTKLLKALSDPTRREIFHVLVVTVASLSISQISDQFSITRQGVTKHLKVLEEANLIYLNNKGRERYCHANTTPLINIHKWLNFYEKYWDDKLSDLGNYLDQKS